MNHLTTAVTGAMLTSLILLGALNERAEEEPVERPDTIERVKLDRLMSEYECSHAGLDGEIPARAIIRRLDGYVALVSFDHGWAVHEGKRPGRLLAVCAR